MIPKTTTISIRTYELDDYILIESGTEDISLIVFDGRRRVGDPGGMVEMILSPAKADQIADELKRRVKAIRESSGKRDIAL